MTRRTPCSAPRSASRLGAVIGALFLAAAVVTVPTTSQALPPGGASPDTPGTSGTASPTSLKAGERISFSIQGFPAGEVVSVKIDDGEFCSAKGQHGACVVHQQKIGKNGTVRGSFALPDDMGPGQHWLRFLASAEMLDDDGNYLGVKPYSLRGNTDFTVVAAPATTGTGDNGVSAPRAEGSEGSGQGTVRGAGQGSGGSSSGSGAGASAGAGGAAADTGTPSSAPSSVASAAPSTGPDGATTPGSTATSGAPTSVPADGVAATEQQPVALRVPALPTDEVASAAPVEESQIPWIGASVLVGCVALAGGLVAALRHGRRS